MFFYRKIMQIVTEWKRKAKWKLQKGGAAERRGERGGELGKGCVTRPIVNQYVSAVLDCQSALNINGRLQNREKGGKQSENCCCFRPKDILCDKIVQANVGERESSREWQQNEGPPSKHYERKLTLIAENMRQLIDRQMTGHIKHTHTHTQRLTDTLVLLSSSHVAKLYLLRAVNYESGIWFDWIWCTCVQHDTQLRLYAV